MAGRVISISLLATDRISRTMTQAAGATDRLGGAMGRLEKVGKATSLVTAAAGAAALAKAAVPAVAVVAAMPAAMVAAKAATATLKVGLIGVGEAMSAVADGDAKKLNEALKDLSPNARAFVKEAASMKNEVDALQGSVQNRLFAGLDTRLERVGKNLLPTVKTGMTGVAGSLNLVFTEATKTASTPWFKGQVNKVFAGTSGIVKTLSGGVRPLIELITRLAVAGIPLVKQLAGWAVNGIKAANGFLKTGAGTATLTRIVTSAGDRLETLRSILGNVALGLGRLIGQADQFNGTGSNVLGTLDKLTEKFAAWAGSADGQERAAEAFKAFGDVARQVMVVLPLLGGALGIIAKALTSMPPGVQGVVTKMLAWAIVISLVTTRLKVLALATAVFKGSAMLFAFAQGLLAVRAASDASATAATRMGAAIRLNVGVMRMYAAAQLASARAATMQALASGRAAVATKLQAAGARIAAAAQWLWNVAMSANPIGLVVLAIAALVGGIVLAYNKVGWFRAGVQAVFSWLRSAVVTVINFVRDHWRLIIAIMLGPLGILIGLVTKYFGQIKGAVMAGVNAVVGFVRSHWRLLIAIVLGPLGIIIGLVTKYWGLIRSKTAEFLSNLLARARQGLTNIKNAFLAGLTAIVSFFTSRWAAVRNSTNALASALTSKIHALMTGLRNAFSTGVRAIGTAWDKLRDAAKKPVNFMIGTVYNRGIVGLWNKVMGWLHLSGLKLNTMPLLASGGTLGKAVPGMTNGPAAIVGEGRRAHPEYVIPTDPKYRSRAQGLWAAAGGDLQMLKGGGILGSVLGGVKKIAGKVLDIGKLGLELLTNPTKLFTKLASPVLGMAKGIGGSPWASAISAIPKKLIGTMGDGLVQIVKAFNAGYGGSGAGVVKAAASMIGMGDDRGENNNWLTRAAGMPGAPWCALFVSEAIRKASATKRYPGYPSAAVASYVGAMKHVGSDQGRPGDLGAYRGTGHINVIERNLGGGSYRTIGGNEGSVVQRSTRGGQSSILRPLASGGVLGQMKDVFKKEFRHVADPNDRRDPGVRALANIWTMDGGGAVPPRSLSLIRNASSRSEMVMSGAQQDLIGQARGGNTYNINLTVEAGGSLREAGSRIVACIEAYEKGSGTRWRSG